MLRAIAGLCLSLVVTSAIGQIVLWQRTETGMTPNQVRTLYPEASRTDKTLNLAGGSICWLRLSGVEVVGRPLDVTFCFNNDKLDTVLLSTDIDAPLPYDDAKDHFNRVINVLRGKYGRELSFNEKSTNGLTTVNSTFKQGELQVLANFAGSQAAASFVTIFYSRWESARAKNL